MGIKEILAGFMGRRNENKKRLRDIETEIRLNKIAEQKLKSANERELERRFEEKRQEDIKKQLDILREKDRHEFWNDNRIKQKNIFANHKPILTKGNMFAEHSTMLEKGNALNNNKKMFNNNNSLLKTKNIFAGKGGNYFK